MLIANQAAILGIWLAPQPHAPLRVGSLVRDASGAVTFMVDDAFIGLGQRRPIISLAWKGATEDDSIARLTMRQDKMMRGGLLPPFFQNLLPEGALRDLVEREFGTGAFDDFDVLARLGEDLPGAIIARLEAGQAGMAHSAPPRLKQEIPDGKVKFSLAGIQLKFSVLAEGSGVTAPGRDAHGDVILKAPSSRHAFLPEVEHCGLCLAQAVGVRVAQSWLVDVVDVTGIPPQHLSGGQYALAVRRFDRGPGGERIHMEDFAQIIGAIGDRKYTMANDETNLNMIRRFTGDWSGELLEGVRRMVTNVLLGNGDAHLKNWSFLYAEDQMPRLSPAYDLVPTFLYGDHSMALSFGGSRDATKVTLRKFERVAGLVKVSPDLLVREARRTTEAALDLWPGLLREMPIHAEMQERLIRRLAGLTLVKEIWPTMIQTLEPTAGASPREGDSQQQSDTLTPLD